jgi:methionine-rich copper-binding protein CopC
MFYNSSPVVSLRKIASATVIALVLLLLLVVPNGRRAQAVAPSVTLTNYGAGQSTGITFEYTLSVAVSGGRNILYAFAPSGFVMSSLSGAQLGAITTVYRNDVQQTTSTFLSPAGMWSGGIQYWLGSGITAAVGDTVKIVIPSGYITNPGTSGSKTWQFKTAEGSGAAIENFTATTTIAAAPDSTAPTLSSSSPSDNATGVGLSANVGLTFSENVTAVAGKNVVIKKSDGTTFETIAATSGQVSISGSTATVNPSGTFDYLTGYYVLVDAGAFVDAAGNAYAGISSSTALNFVSLADSTAPTLSSSSPSDNATGVATASNISFVFSENVIAVSGKSIVIKKSDGTTIETISVTDGARVSISGSTVTVNPSSSFQYSTGYYVLVDSGAFRDGASNSFGGISTSSTFDFTVIADSVTTTTTTTTIQPSPTTTTASGVPSTIAIAELKPTTVTTVASGSVKPSSSVPIATTSTTSSSSTSTTLPAVIAPTAPVASPGSATALINGNKISMTVSRSDNKLQIKSASIQIELEILNEAGEMVPLDADGNAILSKGDGVSYSVTGAAPGAEMEAWLFSEPFKLGTVIVGEDGRVSGVFPVTREIPAGDHRLVFTTKTSTGDAATVSVGIIAGELGGGVAIGTIIFGTLMTAVLAGLIVPATRRRRRAQAIG